MESGGTMEAKARAVKVPEFEKCPWVRKLIAA